MKSMELGMFNERFKTTQDVIDCLTASRAMMEPEGAFAWGIRFAPVPSYGVGYPGTLRPYVPMDNPYANRDKVKSVCSLGAIELSCFDDPHHDDNDLLPVTVELARTILIMGAACSNYNSHELERLLVKRSHYAADYAASILANYNNSHTQAQVLQVFTDTIARLAVNTAINTMRGGGETTSPAS